MTMMKSLAIAALLVGGTSLAVAQNGLPTGSERPIAGGANASGPPTSGPPGPGVIPHDAPRPQATAPNPNLQSAAPAPSASARTRTAHRAPRAIRGAAGYYGAGYGGVYGAPLYSYAGAPPGIAGYGFGSGGYGCYPTFDYSTGWKYFCPGSGFAFGTGNHVAR